MENSPMGAAVERLMAQSADAVAHAVEALPGIADPVERVNRATNVMLQCGILLDRMRPLVEEMGAGQFAQALRGALDDLEGVTGGGSLGDDENGPQTGAQSLDASGPRRFPASGSVTDPGRGWVFHAPDGRLFPRDSVWMDARGRAWMVVTTNSSKNPVEEPWMCRVDRDTGEGRRDESASLAELESLGRPVWAVPAFVADLITTDNPAAYAWDPLGEAQAWIMTTGSVWTDHLGTLYVVIGADKDNVPRLMEMDDSLGSLSVEHARCHSLRMTSLERLGVRLVPADGGKLRTF